MASPATKKAAKNKSGDKSQNNQNHSRINNAKFDEGMKKFLKIEAAYFLIAKNVNMGKD